MRYKVVIDPYLSSTKIETLGDEVNSLCMKKVVVLIHPTRGYPKIDIKAMFNSAIIFTPSTAPMKGPICDLVKVVVNTITLTASRSNQM